jgi:hypothetical protein
MRCKKMNENVLKIQQNKEMGGDKLTKYSVASINNNNNNIMIIIITKLLQQGG